MTKNNYYNTIQHLKEEIINAITIILVGYDNKLQLLLEDVNLLNDDNNVLESSTAFGFIIEEFVVSKLIKYFEQRKCGFNFKRSVGPTTKISYDCSCQKDNLLIMVNIKAEKEGSHNNAIAAIHALWTDYCIQNKNPKCYLVLKIHYKCAREVNPKSNQRKIFVTRISSFFLEEINLLKCGKDRRNWSLTYKPESGRLQISESNLKNDKLPIEEVSYEKTMELIKKYYGNISIKK